jgi:hypothetical protein
MSAGTMIRIMDGGLSEAGRAVEIHDGADLHTRYEMLTALVMRMGAWLNGPRAQLLPVDAWEEAFSRYQEQLADLRRLGDELRPTTLRPREEPLSGDALVSEVLELFAA